MNPHHNPTAISLFAGAGGCSLGFSLAGYNIVYATDADPKAIATYRANFPATAAECRLAQDLAAVDIASA